MSYKWAWVAGGVFLFASLGAVGPAQAQPERLLSKTDLQKWDGTNPDSKKDYRTPFFQLVHGERLPNKADQEIIEMAAKVYVFFGALPSNQETPGAMFKKRAEFTRSVLYYAKEDEQRAKNKEFRERLAKELIQRFREVFHLPLASNRIAIVNAAQLLPALVALDDKQAAPYLIELVTVQEESSDVVRLFAFKALQDYFTRVPARFRNPHAPNTEREELAKMIDPVIEYVVQPPPGLDKMSEEEKEGARFIRCEAIKVLAKVEIPWMPLLQKVSGQKPSGVKAPVALTLLRVMADGKDGLKLTPSFEERLEAVIGLCQINGKYTLLEIKPPNYNADVAVVAIGRFLLDFAKLYSKDREDKKLPGHLPWKDTSERLRKALESFPQNVPNKSPAQQNMVRILEATKAAYGQIKRGAAVEESGELQAVLKSLPAPNPVVYLDTDWDARFSIHLIPTKDKGKKQ